jgi:isoleucyl-tRNA synthetase
VNKNLIGEKLEAEMQEVRNICSLGLQARAEKGIKVRQPLQELKIKSQKLKVELTDLIKDEINVKNVIFDEKLKTEIELDTKITPELREEGIVRDFVRSVQAKRKEMGLTPKDKIRVYYGSRPEGADNLQAIIEKYIDQIKKQVIAEEIVFDNEFRIEKS